MVRTYDSSRRRKAAERTRRAILRAALELHARGITEFEPLAREAGCSVATVRKYFPNKETLFRNCTRTFGESLEMPDVDALVRVTDAGRRLEQSVAELCRIHEAMFGYAWLGAQLRDDSPTLEAEMRAYEGLADTIADIVTPAGSPRIAGARALLDFLTYRALRLSANLSPEQAREEMTATLAVLILPADQPPAP